MFKFLAIYAYMSVVVCTSLVFSIDDRNDKVDLKCAAIKIPIIAVGAPILLPAIIASIISNPETYTINDD